MDRSASYGFLLTFHSNHALISHCFRDRRRFQSKSAKNSHLRVFCAPADGELRIGIGIGTGVGKTGMMRLPDGRKRFRMGLAV